MLAAETRRDRIDHRNLKLGNRPAARRHLDRERYRLHLNCLYWRGSNQDATELSASIKELSGAPEFTPANSREMRFAAPNNSQIRYLWVRVSAGEQES